MKRNEKKEALKLIQERLVNGKTKDEILQEMSGNNFYTKSDVSKLIASVPDPKKRERYKLINYVLLALLILSLAANVYPAYLMFAEQPYQTIIASLFVLLLYYYFIAGVLRFRGFVYSELVLLGILIIILNLGEIAEFKIWGIANILIVLLFGGLALYLKQKMFPNYGIFGLKKDKDGSYLLG